VLHPVFSAAFGRLFLAEKKPAGSRLRVFYFGAVGNGCIKSLQISVNLFYRHLFSARRDR
jgi:hypothetical protein